MEFVVGGRNFQTLLVQIVLADPETLPGAEMRIADQEEEGTDAAGILGSGLPDVLVVVVV